MFGFFFLVMKNTKDTKNSKFKEQEEFLEGEFLEGFLCVFKNCSEEQF